MNNDLTLGKISVIIPCYNSCDYIGKCLDSLLSQDFPMDMLEIIAVDDGSTDGTTDILDSYEQKFPNNITLIKKAENGGGYIGEVRNIGIDYASGDYIAFIDSDDTVEPSFLRTLFTNAIAFDADIVSCGFNMVKDSGIYGSSKLEKKFFKPESVYDRSALVLGAGCEWYVWGKLYKAAFIKENYIYFPEDRHLSEDVYFHGLTLALAKSYLRISESLYNYFVHENSTFNSDKAVGLLMEIVQTHIDLDNIYQEFGDDFIKIREWFFFMGIYGIYDKWKSDGNQGIFMGNLPKIQEEMNGRFPQIRDNPYILQDYSENSRIFREILFEACPNEFIDQ